VLGAQKLELAAKKRRGRLGHVSSDFGLGRTALDSVRRRWRGIELFAEVTTLDDHGSTVGLIRLAWHRS
jgi:hypothetical protein